MSICNPKFFVYLTLKFEKLATTETGVIGVKVMQVELIESTRNSVAIFYWIRLILSV